MKLSLLWKKILIFAAVLGPAFITSIVGNDAGGITTYSVAGAHFGYSMLWSLIPITILLVIVQEMAARMGVVTGKGLADLIRENFGLRMTFFIMLGLLVANFATTVSEFAGIAAAAEIFGLNRYILIPLTAFLVWGITVKANYKMLEKFFLLLTFFYIAYVVSGILAKPDWSNVAKETFLPGITFTSSYLIVLIGVIGTTITPWMQFYLQSSIVEKGLKLKNYLYTKLEVVFGGIATDVVAFFIVVANGAILFPHGIKIGSAADAAIALKPFAGILAQDIFALGLFGAAFFGAFIIPLSTAFYICEAFGWESGVNKKFRQAKAFYWIIGLLIAISSLIVLLPNMPLVKLMLTSQVINGMILPFILIAMLILVNNEKLMGQYKNSRFYNVVVIFSIAIIIAITLLMLATSVPYFFVGYNG